MKRQAPDTLHKALAELEEAWRAFVGECKLSARMDWLRFKSWIRRLIP